MEKVNNYWVDENNNKWYCEITSEDQAIIYSNSLSNCRNCNGCNDCSYCNDCRYCRYCRYCNDCIYCRYCSNCRGWNEYEKNLLKILTTLTLID